MLPRGCKASAWRAELVPGSGECINSSARTRRNRTVGSRSTNSAAFSRLLRKSVLGSDPSGGLEIEYSREGCVGPGALEAQTNPAPSCGIRGRKGIMSTSSRISIHLFGILRLASAVVS